MVGHRRPQGYALMSHLVDQGWICVAMDYRTAPINRWPRPFLDVQDAFRWTRQNIEDYGGDQDFVAVAGASAGGHMASLLGLAWDYPEFGGTPFGNSPDAVISLYGVYDWEFRGSLYHEGFLRILETVIVGKSQRNHPMTFCDASPINHVRPDAPPFLIVHGTADFLTPVGGARRFNKELRRVSESGVVYYEIPRAVHAFDLLHPGQTASAIKVADEFLDAARGLRKSYKDPKSGTPCVRESADLRGRVLLEANGGGFALDRRVSY